MKSMALTLVFWMTVLGSAQAHARSWLRPATLECSSADGVGAAKLIRISGFDTPTPEADLDGNLQEPIVDGNEVIFYFSNECDNAYGFVFFRDDLDRLARKQLSSVRGLLNYFNGQVIDATPRRDNIQTRTVVIECRSIE